MRGWDWGCLRLCNEKVFFLFFFFFFFFSFFSFFFFLFFFFFFLLFSFFFFFLLTQPFPSPVHHRLASPTTSRKDDLLLQQKWLSTIISSPNPPTQTFTSSPPPPPPSFPPLLADGPLIEEGSELPSRIVSMRSGGCFPVSLLLSFYGGGAGVVSYFCFSDEEEEEEEEGEGEEELGGAYPFPRWEGVKRVCFFVLFYFILFCFVLLHIEYYFFYLKLSSIVILTLYSKTETILLRCPRLSPLQTCHSHFHCYLPSPPSLRPLPPQPLLFG